MSQSKLKFYLGLGGLAISSVALGLYFFKNPFNSDTKEPEDYPKEQIIAVLKAIKESMYPIYLENFKDMAEFSKRLEGARDRETEIDNLRKYLVFENKNFEPRVEAIEDWVYSRHGVTREEFQRHCNQVFNEDPVVYVLKKDIRDSLYDSLYGACPEKGDETVIPEVEVAAIFLKINQSYMVESFALLKSFMDEGRSVCRSYDYFDKLGDITRKIFPQRVAIFEEFGLVERFDEKVFRIYANSKDAYEKSELYGSLSKQVDELMSEVANFAKSDPTKDKMPQLENMKRKYHEWVTEKQLLVKGMMGKSIEEQPAIRIENILSEKAQEDPSEPLQTEQQEELPDPSESQETQGQTPEETV